MITKAVEHIIDTAQAGVKPQDCITRDDIIDASVGKPSCKVYPALVCNRKIMDCANCQFMKTRDDSQWFWNPAAKTPYEAVTSKVEKL